MLSRQFLSWADTASAGERADAARDLARAFLYAEIDRIEQGEMERAMTALLDDPSPLVRRTLAEALAGAAHAPHHMISALASDQAGIAAIVLARSPILTESELVDAAAVSESAGQCAIAGRPGLSAAVAGALAEVGSLAPSWCSARTTMPCWPMSRSGVSWRGSDPTATSGKAWGAARPQCDAPP